MPKGNYAESSKRTVLDHDGNPLVVSGVVLYQIVDTYRAAIEIADLHGFVYTQSEAVLKDVVGRYPYDAPEGTSLRRDVRLGNTRVAAAALCVTHLLFLSHLH